MIAYLFSRQSDNWVLSVYFFLGQTVHDHPERLVRAEGYYAEALRLTIGPILEELDILEVVDSNIGDAVSNVLIRGPLQTGVPKTQLLRKSKDRTCMLIPLAIYIPLVYETTEKHDAILICKIRVFVNLTYLYRVFLCMVSKNKK